MFVVDPVDSQWIELTDGDRATVRVAVPDLQQARRARARVRAGIAAGDDEVAVILDVVVVVADDFRSARRALGPVDTSTTVHYAGTLDGLTGLIADIGLAGVADGVTLISASPRQDPHALGRAVLKRLATWGQARAS
jgi:hypothetical protein